VDDPREPEAPKRCPVCGKKVYDRNLTFCSMKCSDADKARSSTNVAREVAVLMRQYKAGLWTPVD
jgi:predicted nucleic acid-binding Zn ribbon protein